MWIKSFVLSIFLLFTSFIVFNQEEKARRITKILCSDSLYGRGYVNDGVNKAANFLKEEFQKSGIQPFFGDTTYFQPFTMDVNTFPGIIEVKKEDEVLIPGIDFLVDETSPSFTGRLDLIMIDTVFFTEKEVMDSIIEEVVRGEKTGFYIDLARMSPQVAYQTIRQLNVLAMYFGPVVYSTDQKFTWSVGREQMKFPVLYFQAGKIDKKSQLDVKIEAKLIKKFESRNVVGWIPSQNKNAKMIVFTAHYDHLGGMGTLPETYFPGANDNASGTAMLISMADYFIKNPSRYHLVFIAFAGEEAGLIGSEYFIKQQSLDLSKIKFLLNLDIMGSGEEGITAVNGSVHQKEFKKLKTINNKKRYLSQVKSRGGTANSDHYHFHVKGVPSFFIYTMGSNKNYHDVFDTYEELSFSSYDNIVRLLADFVEKL